jgi:hypothetical protein
MWQRIRRRIGLLGGSYQHPDGTIELDFDEKAGVDPTSDSDEARDAKLRRYFGRQRIDARRNLGSGLVTLAALLLAIHVGLPTWQAAVVALLVGVGLHLLVTGRWPS